MTRPHSIYSRKCGCARILMFFYFYNHDFEFTLILILFFSCFLQSGTHLVVHKSKIVAAILSRQQQQQQQLPHKKV